MLEIPIYVISVKRFIDRHQHMKAQAERFGIELEFIWDYDADVLTENDLAQLDASAKLPMKSASTVLKHLQAQKTMVERGQSLALVLEDDVILFSQFSKFIQEVLIMAQQLSPGWLIFLGGADNKIDRRFIETSEFQLIENPLSTAEAYLIDRAGAEKRLHWLENNRIHLPADHFLTWLDQQLELRQYWVSEPLATQGSITGQFATALDANRAKHSALYLRLRYEYNRFRRQTWPRFWARLVR